MTHSDANLHHPATRTLKRRERRKRVMTFEKLTESLNTLHLTDSSVVVQPAITRVRNALDSARASALRALRQQQSPVLSARLQHAVAVLSELLADLAQV